MSIDHLSRPGRSPGSTTFYNQRGVAVTDQWLVVGGRRFQIAELDHFERARGPMSSPVRAALLIGVAELVVVAPVAFVFSTPAAWAIAALTAAAALGGMMFAGQRWPASFQMWADYRSRPTLLFETGNEQEFGQVSRALIRAIERGRRSPHR
ncbi:hypothetical protein GCM10022251_78600 [Phytohabitans flavus]|uniref:Uncharacterized protein n=1 Tax=Phytohabitans flavus TaxID=1076124 RepID=A0A6F8XY29_9ACTN|nr:DUF6232 family protein [Phytohabitans flavus]BCB78746.1 hypothetical protein Pflav_051560 [Phytohabitans flavus]